MKNYLQYFNVEKMGRFPNGAEALFPTRMGVFTKFGGAPDTKGHTVFVIAGLGKPKAYFLWEVFTVDDVQSDGTQYTVSGPGWVLLPPALLTGKDFDAFKNSCANFVTFRSIDELPYCATLRKIADDHHHAEPTSTSDDFCTELIRLLPKNGDTYYYRAIVRQRLGRINDAKEDFVQALKLGTNFTTEAELGRDNAGVVATVNPSKVASQIVAKGVFAGKGPKKPSHVADGAWRAILSRRGQEDFRQQLISAYDGRCAITNTSGEAALEVAMLDGDAATEIPKALLLRGDIRTLFDLHLIRIQPKTRKIVVADELRNTDYYRLNARRLRLPTAVEHQPSRELLQKRWEASGGG